MVQTTDRLLKVVDKDLNDSVSSTTLILEKEDSVIMLTLYPTAAPDYPGESIMLSTANAQKLYHYLGKLLYGR